MGQPNHDQERFRRLYDENYHALLGYALRRSQEPSDAYEVLADVFLVAWRRLPAVPHGTQGRLWLFGVARRVLAGRRRTLYRQKALTARIAAQAPLVETATSQPVGPLEAQTAGIAAAFGRLAPADRDLLVMVGWEGLDSDQIAAVVGCSAATARVRLHRARRRFAHQLARQGVQRDAAAGHVSTGGAAAPPGTKGTT